MATMLYRNSTNTNMKNLSGVNLNETAPDIYSFTGTIGVDCDIDTQTSSIAVTDGEVDVPTTGTGTYSLVVLAGSERYSLAPAP